MTFMSKTWQASRRSAQQYPNTMVTYYCSSEVRLIGYRAGAR